MKKAIMLLLAALCTAATSLAYDFQSGDLYYIITSVSTVKVTYQNTSSSNYLGLTSAIIPSSVAYNGTTYSVTSIGSDAFSSCSGLTSITIPNSVTSIGERAFKSCSGLTAITIPNSVTSIGTGAFKDCTGLTSVTIPNSVTSIGDYAFYYCYGLTSITIPNSVTSIGDYAFDLCDGLTSINVENGNSKYDSRNNCNAIVETETNTLIFGCSATVIPNSVTSIGDYAFEGCSDLTSVTIPNSVTSIGDGAFEGCYGLTSITIPNSVTSIGDYAFHGCFGLTSITIPNSVTSIENGAFSGCTGLTAITIPNSVTSIGDYAFSDCSGLTSVTIGNSVTSIGDNAFIACAQLTSITCEAKTPPSCDISSYGNPFTNIPANCTIKVPCGCLEAYNTAPWYNYQLAIIPPPSLQVQPSSESLGSTKIDKDADCDSTAIVSATANYGYHFVQWTDSATSNPRTIKLTQDTLLTAEFARNSYRILTSYEGAGKVEGDSTALYKDSVTLTAIPDYGWEFSYWNENNIVRLDNPRKIEVTADCSFKAIFVKRNFNLTASCEHGTITGSGTYAYETNCSLTATPAVGYHFVQWSDGVTENPRSIVLTQDTNLTAEFAKNSYRIYLTHDGEGAIEGDTTALYQDSVTLTAVADYGWQFSGWEDGSTENPRVVVATEDKDYKAIFVKRMFTITLTGENGTFEGAGSFAYEDTCQLTAIANVGYHFVQWSDGITENPRSIVLTKDTNLTAEFAKNTYAINLTHEGEGSIEGDTTALYQDTIALNAIADYGWQFSGWSDGVLDNPRSVVVTANCSYQAIFVRRQFSISATGENGVLSGTGTFAFEDTCQVTATPNAGYHFVQWGDGVTENPRSIVLTKDTNLTAEFAKNAYNIALTHEGEGAIEGDTTALYQDTIALNAVADYGWQFSGWSDGVLDNPRSIVVTADCEYHAIFVRQQISLTAIAENGVVDGVGTFAYEDTCQLTATPNTGYHFVQWSDGVTENPRSIVLTKDTNLTAEFAKNAYTITLTHEGEGAIEGDITALYQDTIALNAVADYGWQFSGWSDGVLDNPRSIVVTADCAYRAIFVKRNFTIATAGENGTIAGGGTYAYETNCSLTATPNTGYHFVQWSDGITANPRTIILTKDTNLTAEFAKNSYSIALTVSGGGSISGETTALYQDTITLAATADYGWQFSGWSDGVLDNPRSIVVTADCAYQATFVKRNFTIATAGENGTIAGGGTYAYETNCSLTATPAVGYHFVQWSDGITANPRSIVLTKDTNLTAEFAKNAYNITLTHEGEGAIEGDTTALYQDTIALNAVADYGWQFSGWSDGVTANPRSVVITADCSYQANFVRQQFSITATAENGSVSGVGSFAYEDTCSLTATPATGYHFVQWSDGVTENPRSIVLTKDTNLTAEFAKNAYNIALTHEGEGAIEGDTTALYQDTIALNAVADYGWQFSGWSDGVLDNPRSIVVTADCEYHAIFVRQQFSLTAIAENGVVDGVGTFAYEDTCTLTATPNTGYHFVQWSDGVTENPRSIVLTKDTNLTAEFAKNSYQITTSHTGNGMTMGDTTALYQDTITLSALADYGWEFSGWEDGNTENPRVVVATEDKDYKAIFVKRMFTITLTGENGSFEGAGSFAYGDTCQLTAIANVGYHFVQWSDSITDNPRSIVLTQDTMFTAEFAKNYFGQCGDSLYWIYDTTTISIIGSGAMYNYSDSLMPWYLFRDSITAIEMVNTATTIGDYAFANCNKLSKLMIGESMESVGSNAFMGCTQLTNITCHPIIPPYAETSSFENYDAYLLVPCSSKSQYMADAVWGQFKYIECIEEETDIESVESESSEQSVRKIYRDGNVYIIRDGEEYSILGQKL